MSKETWVWRKIGISLRLKGMNNRPYLQARGMAVAVVIALDFAAIGLLIDKLF